MWRSTVAYALCLTLPFSVFLQDCRGGPSESGSFGYQGQPSQRFSIGFPLPIWSTNDILTSTANSNNTVRVEGPVQQAPLWIDIAVACCLAVGLVLVRRSDLMRAMQTSITIVLPLWQLLHYGQMFNFGFLSALWVVAIGAPTSMTATMLLGATEPGLSGSRLDSMDLPARLWFAVVIAFTAMIVVAHLPSSRSSRAGRHPGRLTRRSS